MSPVDLLVKEGAWSHCARLIYRNQDVGLLAEDGTLALTEAGKEIYAKLANITDVEVKPAKTRKPKADAEPVVDTNPDLL